MPTNRATEAGSLPLTSPNNGIRKKERRRLTSHWEEGIKAACNGHGHGNKHGTTNGNASVSRRRRRRRCCCCHSHQDHGDDPSQRKRETKDVCVSVREKGLMLLQRDATTDRPPCAYLSNI